MAFEKFTHVAVQPVHVIPGLEYGDIVSDADELRADGTFASLVVGAPLLTESQASVDRAARALLAELPSGRAPGEPVLFMGHGSRHAAESRYEALAAAVRERDPLCSWARWNGTSALSTSWSICGLPGVRSIVSGCCPCSPSWGGIRLKTWLGIRTFVALPARRRGHRLCSRSSGDDGVSGVHGHLGRQSGAGYERVGLSGEGEKELSVESSFSPPPTPPSSSKTFVRGDAGYGGAGGDSYWRLSPGVAAGRTKTCCHDIEDRQRRESTKG